MTDLADLLRELELMGPGTKFELEVFESNDGTRWNNPPIPQCGARVTIIHPGIEAWKYYSPSYTHLHLFLLERIRTHRVRTQMIKEGWTPPTHD